MKIFSNLVYLKEGMRLIMDRMKTFFKYAIWIFLFFIFSELLINVGLNSSYKDISIRDNTSQVEITQAQATLVNGRMKGTIKNSSDDFLTGKYVRIDFYSNRDVFLGKKYIEINTTQNISTQDFNIYFELQDVTSYSISVVNEKEEGEIKLIPEDLTKPEIIILTAMTLLIFWG